MKIDLVVSKNSDALCCASAASSESLWGLQQLSSSLGDIPQTSQRKRRHITRQGYKKGMAAALRSTCRLLLPSGYHFIAVYPFLRSSHPLDGEQDVE